METKTGTSKDTSSSTKTSSAPEKKDQSTTVAEPLSTEATTSSSLGAKVDDELTSEKYVYVPFKDQFLIRIPKGEEQW